MKTEQKEKKAANSKKIEKIWKKQLVNTFKRLFGEDNVESNEPDKNKTTLPNIDAPYFWIDFDYGEHASLSRTLRKAENKCDLERPLLAICQKPHRRTMIAMYFDDFISFLDDIKFY